MKLTGKIVTSISSGLCILISIFMMVLGVLTVLSVEYINEQAEGLVSEEELNELHDLAHQVEEESIFEEMRRHGTIGLITSLITFITCFITIPKAKFVFPAIAGSSAIVGAIMCGWFIMIFLLVALLGIALILWSHYKPKNAVETA